jgi:hypothetical protein
MDLKWYKLNLDRLKIFSKDNIGTWRTLFDEIPPKITDINLDKSFIPVIVNGEFDAYWIDECLYLFSLSDFKIITETLKETGFFWDYLEDDREVIKNTEK